MRAAKAGAKYPVKSVRKSIAVDLSSTYGHTNAGMCAVSGNEHHDEVHLRVE